MSWIEEEFDRAVRLSEISNETQELVMFLMTTITISSFSFSMICLFMVYKSNRMLSKFIKELR